MWGRGYRPDPAPTAQAVSRAPFPLTALPVAVSPDSRPSPFPLTALPVVVSRDSRPAPFPGPRSLHKSYSPLPKAARRPADAPSATAVRGYGEESPPPSAPAGYGTLTLEQRRRAEALVADMEAIEALNPDDASSDEEGEGGAGAAAGGGGGSWEVTTGNFTVRPRPGVTGGGE